MEFGGPTPIERCARRELSDHPDHRRSVSSVGPCSMDAAGLTALRPSSGLGRAGS
jgi:hypothetical protein